MRKKYMVNLLVLNLSEDKLSDFVNHPNCIALHTQYSKDGVCILKEAEFAFSSHDELLTFTIAWLTMCEELGPLAHEALRAIL
mgnify:CR=1 FL=1